MRSACLPEISIIDCIVPVFVSIKSRMRPVTSLTSRQRGGREPPLLLIAAPLLLHNGNGVVDDIQRRIGIDAAIYVTGRFKNGLSHEILVHIRSDLGHIEAEKAGGSRRGLGIAERVDLFVDERRLIDRNDVRSDDVHLQPSDVQSLIDGGRRIESCSAGSHDDLRQIDVELQNSRIAAVGQGKGDRLTLIDEATPRRVANHMEQAIGIAFEPDEVGETEGAAA